MRAYRTRLSFKLLRVFLSIDIRLAAFLIGGLYCPFLLAGFTVGLIAFLIACAALLWLNSVPRWVKRDDGNFYFMDGNERAEWVFENKRFPKL